jgi:hypothetical protein
MRISDILASNWNYIWAFFILLLKSLQVSGLFSLLEGTRFSSLTLLVLSAIISFMLISFALLMEVLVILHSNSNCPGLKNSNGRQTCNGGIRWLIVHSNHILCNDNKEFICSINHSMVAV